MEMEKHVFWGMDDAHKRPANDKAEIAVLDFRRDKIIIYVCLFGVISSPRITN